MNIRELVEKLNLLEGAVEKTFSKDGVTIELRKSGGGYSLSGKRSKVTYSVEMEPDPEGKSLYNGSKSEMSKYFTQLKKDLSSGGGKDIQDKEKAKQKEEKEFLAFIKKHSEKTWFDAIVLSCKKSPYSDEGKSFHIKVRDSKMPASYGSSFTGDLLKASDYGDKGI